jgi:GNAT superfamily N-acetyltransferase
MSAPTVRRATPGDAVELARLRWDFRVEHGTPVTRDFHEFVEEFRAFAADTLADGSEWRAWLAEQGGRAVGCLWIRFIEKVPHPSRRRRERSMIYVTNVYVEPALRNCGTGGELMDAALAHARAEGVAEAIVWPTERSIPFYERAGFGTERAPLLLDLKGD